MSDLFRDTERALHQRPPLPLRLGVLLRPTIAYLFSIECHVYAFAIAACVLLSFFPFMVLILSLTQNVIRWPQATSLIYTGLQEFLPADPGLVDFVLRNVRVAVQSRTTEVLSLALLLFSSNGVFVPLEVALNRLWGITAHRSYWRNLLVSLGFAFICGVLALLAILLGTANLELFRWYSGPIRLAPALTSWALKLAYFPVAVLAFFLVFWVLPNAKIPAKAALLAAILTELAVDLTSRLYVWVWPMLNFRRAYGPFFISVTLLIWGYLAAMMVLAGAELGVRWARSLRFRAVAEDESS
jgi:membrane protein/epoxyqueuosine reductase